MCFVKNTFEIQSLFGLPNMFLPRALKVLGTSKISHSLKVADLTVLDVVKEILRY